jgi:hypothetical protein
MLLEKKEPDFTISTKVEREEERNLIGGNELRRTSCENLEGKMKTERRELFYLLNLILLKKGERKKNA